MAHESTLGKYRVAIIGSGPAGCICAKYLSEAGFEVTLFDKGKFLRTILPTGGGRCNLAHAEYDFRELAKNYPRGEKFLYSIFSRFGTADTIDFFKKIGIEVYTQDDNRIFPISNSSSDVRSKIINSLSRCHFINEKVLNIIPPLSQAPLPPNMGKNNVLKNYSRAMRKNLTKQELKLWLQLRKKQLGVKFRRQHPIDNKYIADFACIERKLIIEVDGSQHIDSVKDKFRTYYLEEKGYKIIRFYNNDIDNNLESCITFINRELTKRQQELLNSVSSLGEMPDDLSNSTYKCFAPSQGEMPKAKGVKYLLKTDKNTYTFDYVVVAIGGHASLEILKELDIKIQPQTQALVGLTTKEDFSDIAGVSIKDILFTHKGVSGPAVYKISSIRARDEFPYQLSFKLIEDLELQLLLDKNPHKEIKNLLGQIIPKSLAVWILENLNIVPETPCHRIDGKTRDRILNSLTNFNITVTGKFPDGEVVTCGGVDLNEVNAKTLESKQYKGLYFCGEILDIDGFCGGFNLQNCWSTGFVVSQSINTQITT